VADAALAADRPVYLGDAAAPRLAPHLARLPSGLALRLLPRTSPLPAPATLEASLAQSLRRWPPRLPAYGLPLRASEAALLQRWALPWRTLARAYEDEEDRAAAARCDAVAESFELRP